MIKKVKEIYPALSRRNFRYYWFGQCISLIGTWMQATAQQWLIYSLTKSGILLGLLGVAQFGPVMFLSLFAGVFIDRYPKKRLLIFTQCSLMIQAFILAFLVWTGHVTYWHVFILAILLGLINTLDQPTRQAFMPELVEKKDLRSAIGLNSAVFNVARMIGPALSAVMMAKYGAGLLFFLNGISFIPVIIGISLIRVEPSIQKKIVTKVTTDIKEGLQYIKKSSILCSTILSMLAVGTFVMNLNVITPLYAGEVLKEGVNSYGMLLSATGGGSLVGALIVASWAKGMPKLKLLLGSGFVVSLLLIFLEPIHSLGLAVVAFVVVGFFSIMFTTTANSMIQFNTSDQFRGRVMSVYSFAFLGTTPIGNLFAGSVMEKLGAGIGVAICGAISALFILLITANVIRQKNSL
jgi:predicted MFS family arabinose efflux permease